MKRLRWWRKPKKRSNEADPGRYFAALRNQAPHDSFPEVQTWLAGIAEAKREESSSASDTRQREQHIKMPLSPMKTYLHNHKKRLVLTSLVLAVTFISCTTPVEQEDTVGHMITGIIDGNQTANASEKITALNWMKAEYLEQGLISGAALPVSSLNKTNQIDSVAVSQVDHRFVIALPETEEAQANAWAYDLKLIEGIRDVEVAPLQITMEKPAYKVVLHSIWEKQDNLEFIAQDDQIRYAVNTYLEDLEMHGVDVNQMMDEKGNYVLSLTPPTDINKSGLSTLKRFLSEVHSNSTVSKNGASVSPAESIVIIEQKLEELELKMSQSTVQAEKEKYQHALQQMTTKLEALKAKQVAIKNSVQN